MIYKNHIEAQQSMTEYFLAVFTVKFKAESAEGQRQGTSVVKKFCPARMQSTAEPWLDKLRTKVQAFQYQT